MAHDVRYHLDELRVTGILGTDQLVLIVSGWVTRPYPTQPFAIDLRCNSKSLGNHTAAKSRPDVIKVFERTEGKAGGPNECCGFKIAVRLPKVSCHVQVLAKSGAETHILGENHVAKLVPRDDCGAGSPSRRALLTQTLREVVNRLGGRHFFSLSAWRQSLRQLSNALRLTWRIQRKRREQHGKRKPWKTPYEAYLENNRLSQDLRHMLAQVANTFLYQPRISIVMPVYNVHPKWLAKAVQSIREQVYPHWELCVADDASDRRDRLKYLEEIATEPRIKIHQRAENGHICAASNTAAALATGDFLVFMDHDDALAPHALFEIARLLQQHPDADLIYSDEDKIDAEDRRYDPLFKPDWSPELLLGYNYINHLVCLRRSVFDHAGKFRPGYEGAQDFDLLLRVSSITQRIHHISKVLYHWRALPSSTASSPTVKPMVHRAVRRALEYHISRQGYGATVYKPEIAHRFKVPIYQLDWPDQGPRVAVIIPTSNQYDLLRQCISTLVSRTTYRNYRIVVVDNDSNEPATLRYFDELRNNGIEVLRLSNEGRPFSFSHVMNRAVAEISDELVLLLNDDTEVLEPRWLSRMVGYLSLPGVGATGARLLFSDGTIQHAGVLLGMHHGIAPDHAFRDQASDACSYGFQAELARNCTAVTAACLLTRRDTFVQVGGLDENNYAVTLNDVDFCLRLQEHNLRVVYVGGAELLHHESQTRSRRDDPRELATFRRQYEQHRDPFYSPNFSRVLSHVVEPACQFDYDSWYSRPVHALFITHNLNLEGAPKALYEIAAGCKRNGNIQPTLWSSYDGPQHDWYRQVDIDVHIEKLPNCDNVGYWSTSEDYEEDLNTVRRVFQQQSPDVIVVNTLLNFHMVNIAAELGIPVLWIIYESYSTEDLLMTFNVFTAKDWQRAFQQATQVIFVSAGTCNLYHHFNSERNFMILHNGIDSRDMDTFMQAVTPEEAQTRIQSPPGKTVLTTVGTVSERKAQHLLVEAAAQLRTSRDDFVCYLVGMRETAGRFQRYAQWIHSLIDQYQLHDFVKPIGETSRVFDYLRATDVFVHCSWVEGYCLAILEAEAFGLPIVTTPCCGVAEQVRPEVNAFLYPMGDAAALARRLEILLNDADRRKQMGKASRGVFEFLKQYDDMLSEYEQLILRAALQSQQRDLFIANDDCRPPLAA